jgi:peptidyl-prolyl cis-trans isomerase B (cyclophilin B)
MMINSQEEKTMKSRVLVGALALALPLAASAQSLTPACEAAMKAAAPKVKLSTSMGPIVIELEKEKAPISTANFVKYVSMGHYDGTVFHRVIKDFMIQGGGLGKDMAEKQSGAPIKNESTNGLKNAQYTVAMARTQARDSATAQFFINTIPNGFLDFRDDMNPGYAVFGKVVEGKETVEKIRAVPVQRTQYSEATPLTPVVIEKAECAAAAPAAAPKK